MQRTARCKQYVNNTWQSVELHQHTPSPLSLIRRGRKPCIFSTKWEYSSNSSSQQETQLVLAARVNSTDLASLQLGNDQNWINSVQYIHLGMPVGSHSWACLDIGSAKQTKWEMFPDTLALHQPLLVHGDHHHLPLLASIQHFSAPIKLLASLTGLSRRQLTALMFSLPMWKVCASGRHRKQGSASPQLPLTQYLNYGIGHLPQIPAFCQERVRDTH